MTSGLAAIKPARRFLKTGHIECQIYFSKGFFIQNSG